MGRARTGGWLGVVIIAVAVTGGGGDAESAEDVVSCFEDAELTEVEDGEVSDAEDIGALEEAAEEEADGFVSALDSEGRDVFVLLYDSEEAQSDVAGERDVGLRDDKLLIYSAGRSAPRTAPLSRSASSRRSEAAVGRGRAVALPIALEG
jgi:hypothetical protein